MAKEGKARIIEAALRVISRSGIAGATMRGIAEEAGMSTGAIYHYYTSKEEILYAVMDESLSVSKRIAEEVQQGKRSRDEFLDEIHGNILLRFEKSEENRLQFYLAQESMLGNEELREKFKAKYKEWISRTEELIANLYGSRQSRLNHAFASLLIGAIDGMVLQILLGANTATSEDIAEVYHLILRDGIPKFLVYLNRQEEQA